uniref:NADH dehydrogenase [ubiquinone] 1 beta subcomplex subunit 3 n=1 Tax=Plectus sambesii TaxID=2011161 RepID=A0A914UWX6_9BILA
MGGGHHHEPFKVPDYKVYNNWQAFPQLAAHQERLGRIGLKDPWIRNSVYLFDYRWASQGGWPRMVKNTLFRGWKTGVVAAIVVIALEESYMKMKHGHTSWGAHH